MNGCSFAATTRQLEYQMRIVLPEAILRMLRLPRSSITNGLIFEILGLSRMLRVRPPWSLLFQADVDGVGSLTSLLQQNPHRLTNAFR
ncbi:hypothetical protein Leryth_018865 [Lithospermum erythrorhizon]|nr:hypothetical protein Leryth_018865 [Lithospermum erythrorhizon]